MADKTTIEQMLEHLVNGEQDKAEELFHEYVVAQSREIYEGLIESEMSEEEEAAKKESEVEENFEVAEAGDEEGEEGEEKDPTDNLMRGLEDEDDGDDDSEEEGMDEPATKQDVVDGFDELMSKFDELAAGLGGDHEEPDMDNMGGPSDMDADNMGMGMKDAFEPQMATVREYVEKVGAGHGAEKKGSAEQGGGNTKSTIDNMKNDMGGTTANIVSGRNGADAGYQGMTGDLKGSGLLKGKPQAQDGGNINVPGGKAGSAFSKKEPGHGAEKKGAGEQGGANTASLFRNK
jgi:hypothetical protein